MNRSWMLGREALAIAAIVMIAGPVSAAEGVAPLRARTSDAVIARDLAQVEQVERGVVALTEAQRAGWYAGLAESWAAVAREQYLANDETGWAGRALAEAHAALSHAAETPDVLPAYSGAVSAATAAVVELERLKAEPGQACAAGLLAQAEVALRVAEHDAVVCGTCASAGPLARADRALALANARIAACAPAPASTPAPEPVAMPIAAPVAVPPMAVPTQEELRIPRDVYFALARHDISAASERVIQGIAELMLKYPSIRVHLVGHTDSRASVAYNLKLSERRVGSVRAGLMARGITPDRISGDWKGKAEQAAVEDSRRGFALNRRVEMLFSDSEGRTIEAEHQEQDLQLEPEKPSKH